jgi:hypothetical protein
MFAPFLVVAALAFAVFTSAGSLKDTKRVILFMQENRAFDHVCLTAFPKSIEYTLTSSSALEQCLVFEDVLAQPFKSDQMAELLSNSKHMTQLRLPPPPLPKKRLSLGAPARVV